MKSTVLAGVFALALSATLPVAITQVQAMELSNAGALTQVNVARIRTAL
jgi:hypothetical protein